VPELLTPEEVAGIFKLKRIRTVYDWIAEGLFPNVICIRKQYRIPQADVDRLIEQSKTAGLCPPPAPTKRRVISRGVQ
jgi:excisionase family DNA binding protein